MINHVEAMKVTLHRDMLALISFRLYLIVYTVDFQLKEWID